MKKRNFGIPSLTALALPLGCTPAIVGDWEVVEVDGEDFPLVYSYTYDGTTVTYKISASMGIEEDLKGDFELRYSYTYGDEQESYAYSCAVKAVEKGDLKYKIDVTGDECEMSLSCTLDEDGERLECEDKDDDVAVIFERDE